MSTQTPSPSGIASSKSNTSTILSLLSERDLLAYGELTDGSYTDRDKERARLVKFVAQHPEGVLRTMMVHTVIRGHRLHDGNTGFADVSGNALERHTAGLDDLHNDDGWTQLDGSDADYQFVYNFSKKLEDAELVQLSDSPAGVVATPTLEALDLISEGITENPRAPNEIVYDREFCAKSLKATTSRLKAISDSQKNLFANSLRRYIRRVDDYQLVFDVTVNGARNQTESRRMTKDYATRFNDAGRVDKAFARLQASLEHGADLGDTAVFATLTTDPKKHDSLYDAIIDINENFHNLTQWMKTDPETVHNTRRENVPAWRPALDSSNFHFGKTGAVSGRPRERLEYIKVLEFTSKGYPHLHVLFFDPPARDSDGMPWLMDKGELSDRWDNYGQGSIVDLYPLTYRDDLDELGNFGETVVHDENGNVVYTSPEGVDTTNPGEHDSAKTTRVSEGFVCWYQHGDHDHSQEWVDEKQRYHSEDGLIDMDGDDEVMQQKTAGSYIGKYISETYGELLDRGEAFQTGNFDHSGKSTWWKLAMYWATGRQFWSISHGIEEAIALDDHLDAEVRKAVTECSRISVLHNCNADRTPHALYPEPSQEKQESAIHRLVRGMTVQIDYLGAYAYWDMPKSASSGPDLSPVEKQIHDDNEPINLVSNGDRPPPIESVY